MARSYRTWSDILTEIRYALREPDVSSSFWTDTELMYLYNQERDRISVLLNLSYEGHNVLSYTADLVADQESYEDPVYANRVMRLLRVFPDGTKVPLMRSEDWASPTLPSAASNLSGYLPTYRILGEHLFLNPAPPESETGGLEIEVETSPDRITSTSDQAIPDGWPKEIETLLVLRTAIAAFDVEGSQGPSPEGIYSSLKLRSQEIEAALVQSFEVRNRGVVSSPGFYVGD